MNELIKYEPPRINLEDFEKIMGKVTEPIFVINEFHKLIYANKAFYDFIGKNNNELLDKVLDLGDDEKYETFFDGNNTIFESGEEAVNQENFIHPTKGSKRIQIKRNLILNSKGEKLIIGIINDLIIQKEFKGIIDKTREIIKSIQVGIILYDINLNIVEWNPFMEKLSGCKAEKALGKHPVEIFPSLIEKCIGNLYGILGGDSNLTQEFPLVLASGETVFVSNNLQALTDSGKIFGILQVIQNITHHKKLERTLSESEFFFRESQERANLGSYRANFVTGLWDSSPVFNKIFGVTKECESIPNWLEFIHPDDSDMIMTYLSKEIIKKKNRFDKKYRIIRGNDGETRWIHQLGEIVCNNDGRIISMTGIVNDITDHKKSEENLVKINRTLEMINKCNEALLRIKTEQELLDAICNIFIEDGGYRMSWVGYIQDGSKKVIPVSKAGIEEGYLSDIKISYDKNEINGRGPTGTAIREKKYIIANNIPTNINFEFWRDAAMQRGYSSSIALPLITEDKILGALMIYSTNPEDFNKEEVKLLEKLSANLSYGINNIRIKEEKIKNEERLKKNEEYIRTKQRMDTVGTLVGGIAHDFNNMLSGIMGYLDLLNITDYLTPDQDKYIKNALIGCDNATKLIRRLQALSRNQFSEKVCIDIHQIILETFDILSHSTDRIINKIIDNKENSFYVIGNNIELQQVLLNLGTNSIRAIGQRGAKDGDFIKITTDNYIQEKDHNIPAGEYVYITFEDNGVGMSKEILEKAFDPFFSTGERGVQKGQGLGLSTVYSIIRNHNGFIHIESKEGKGTIVHIYLPKVQLGKKDTPKESINIPLKDKTILVIDDEEIICELTETMLKRNGCHVFLAYNGQEGLEMFEKNQDSIDLVILDLTMPKMSGQNVLEKLLELKKDIKVIITSGQSDEDAKEGILKKAKGVLHKPFKLDIFIKTIQQILNEN